MLKLYIIWTLKEVMWLENITEIQSLLLEKADILSRLKLLPYDGTPEVKTVNEQKYLYIRKRVGSRRTSTYVGAYSDDLYQLLLRNAKERREHNKTIRTIDKKLLALGYIEGYLDERIQRNLDFARVNMKANIYDQAVLEGVATTFPQTEEIIDNGMVYGMSVTDVQKILNLKHAWEFVLDKDVLQVVSDYYILCHIARLINEDFFTEGGRIRSVPVAIGGTKYVPPIPMEIDVKDTLKLLVAQDKQAVDIAIEICMYCMRTQIFMDGNKRAAVIFANHYLIAHGGGLLVIPEKDVPEFKRLLVRYYESNDLEEIRAFLKDRCWRKLEQ